MIRVTLLLAPGSIGSAVMGFADMLLISNRVAANQDLAAPFELRLVSVDGEPVTASNGYPLAVDGAAQAAAGGVLMVPAVLSPAHVKADTFFDFYRPQIDWLRGSHRLFDTVATHCSGTLLLAESGLLDGRPAATSWWLAKTFARRYPQVNLDADAICVRSDPFLLGGSSSSHHDVALAVIGQYAGQHNARLVAKYMLLDNQRRSQAPYAIFPAGSHDDPVVAKAEDWIYNNLQRDFRIEEVAQQVAVSPRTLIRRFQNSLGESPQAYTQRVRIEKSKTLLETTQLRLSEIVYRCGYSDESAFRRLFKKLCQLSPSEYRRRFNSAYKESAEVSH